MCSLGDFTSIKEERDQRAEAKTFLTLQRAKIFSSNTVETVNPKKSPYMAISANTCEFRKLDDYIFCYKDILVFSVDVHALNNVLKFIS